MSIIASVKVHDGIALGADSASQIFGKDPQGQVGVIKAFQNAQKLYQIGELPIGVGTYGIGNLGPRSIGSFILEFGQDIKLHDSVERVAIELYKFILTEYDSVYGNIAPESKPELGFLVGGYSSNQPLAEEWEFTIPKDAAPKKVRESNRFGASWRGISLPFTRLHRGVDPRLLPELKKAGIQDETLDQIKTVANGMSMPVVFDGMPLQDALDFLSFILRTTIDVSRFEPGQPACGGPLTTAVITKGKGFQWISEPKLSLK